MLKRIISSVVGFPLLAIMIYTGDLALKGILVALSILGMGEIYKAFGKNNTLNLISYLAVWFYFFFLDLSKGVYLIVFIFVYLIVNLIVMVFDHERTKPVNAATNIFGFFYVSVMFSAIYLTRMAEYGKYFVWLIFISAWGSDTFAYITGTTIGRHKLPKKLNSLSPNKTIEGCIGGIIGAGLISAVYALIINRVFNIDKINVLFCFVGVSVVGALFSQVGDLVSSAIKRHYKIKDYGKIIPGHGGIIDRFDSILLTAPVIYILIYYILR